MPCLLSLFFLTVMMRFLSLAAVAGSLTLGVDGSEQLESGMEQLRSLSQQ